MRRFYLFQQQMNFREEQKKVFLRKKPEKPESPRAPSPPGRGTTRRATSIIQQPNTISNGMKIIKTDGKNGERTTNRIAASVAGLAMCPLAFAVERVLERNS